MAALARPRRWLGAAIVLAGAATLLHRAAAFDPRLLAALEGGAIAALATALGALPLLLSQRLSARTGDALLGLGAGVMLAATAFSLVIPGLQAARGLGLGGWGAGLLMGAGLLVGALALLAAGRRFAQVQAASVWMFVFAIVLHNVPEGLAIGVATAGDAGHARALVTGIAIQDVPEGLVVALALLGAGCSRGRAVALGAASGLVEPVAAVAGAAAVTASAVLLPWGMAIAAGAMLYAVAHHAIPSAHGQGHGQAATLGVIAGYVLMMVLDTALA